MASSIKKSFHNSTSNNTNNNSISSIKKTKYPNHNVYSSAPKNKKNLFNQKVSSSKSKHNANNIKQYAVGNNKNFPISLLSKTNSQFLKYSFFAKQSKNPNKNNKNCKSNNTSNIKQQSKSVNTNNYIINTLNVSGKNFLHSNISSAKPKKSKVNKIPDFENEITKIQKEKEELENIFQKQEKLIKKLEEENQNLEEKIDCIVTENKKISKKIIGHQENQEQLVMLVKIVQKSGVDVEKLIDKWNNEVDMENNVEKSENFNISSVSESINDLECQVDPASFIPINIEKPVVNKKVFNGIPKLNFEVFNNNEYGNKKEKFRNNSK